MFAKKKITRALAIKYSTPGSRETHLLSEVRELILAKQQTVARGVNAALVMLYWNIGQSIRQDILVNKPAE